MTRAAIYARYSSDNQREASIEDQIRLCRDRLARDGAQLAQTFSDRAISGATMQRPGLQALLEEAMAGKFEVVYAEALDRISRDQADVATVYKRLTFAGVQIVTAAEGHITELHVGLKGTMNALYLKDLADKTRRGLRGRVEAGRSGGGNSYGYTVVPGEEGGRGAREIDPEQARIVERIFRKYAAGESPRRIAYTLNSQGVAGPSGRDWSPSTINGNPKRGTGILNNELYIGRMIWNRLRYIKDPKSGKRVSRLNPPDRWIIKELPELRIVDQDLWDTVKARQQHLKKNTRPDVGQDRPFWERTRPRYLLSGLMKCGACGGSYSKISKDHFGCATARNKGTCKNLLNIRQDRLETTVLDGLKHHLMSPELFEVFAEEFTTEVNRLRTERAADRRSLDKDIERIVRQIDQLVTAVANGADALALNNRIKDLEQRKAELEEQREGESEDAPVLIHPNLAALYRAKVMRLSDLLDNPGCRNEAFQVIRSLIDQVRLVPEKGGLRVELRGELAGILALCDDAKLKPASPVEKRVEQIKVVAGAGFEPATFRL